MKKEILYNTCEQIVGVEINGICEIVLSRLDTLMTLTDNGKKLRTLREKVEDLKEYSKSLNGVSPLRE